MALLDRQKEVAHRREDYGSKTLNNFYVYILFREDGLTPFYVGLGRGKRWQTHEYRFGDNIYRDNIIKKIHRSGYRVIKIKVAQNINSWLAGDIEKTLISAYGRHDLGLGPLANLTDGGEGCIGAIITDEMRRSKSERMKKWHAENPEWAIAHSARGKLRMSIPENRSSTAEKTRRAWQDPEIRKRYVDLHKDNFTEAKKNRLKEARDRYFAEPENRRATADRTRVQFSDPEQKIKVSNRFKKLWADPSWRASILEKRAKARAYK